MKKILLVMFMILSTLGFAKVFNNRDYLKVGATAETTKGGSALNLEYGVKLGKVKLYDPNQKPNTKPDHGDRSRALVSKDEDGTTWLNNVEVGAGVQTRILSGHAHNHQAYYGTVGYTINIDHNIEYLPKKVKPVARVGFATDLDGKGGGFYAGGGAEIYVTDNAYISAMFESEDREYRNTFGIGYKF